MSDCTFAPALGAMDVHARSIRLVGVRDDALIVETTLPHEYEVVERELRRCGITTRVCYEAGPTGFALARHLRSVGIECEVIAPSEVPVRAGDRIKTDARDARRLARLYAGGMLEPIFIPTAAQEAVRDLVRAREDARHDRMRARHRMSKFCLRHGRQVPSSGWTLTRREWLGQQAFDHIAQQAAFDDYLLALDLVDRRIATLEAEIDRWAHCDEFADVVGRLRCLRGVDTLTAVGLVAEIGDFARFKDAPSFMSYVGLVPSEHSSGEQRARGPITRTGNGHVRRLLIEAAHNQRRRPARSAHIAKRQAGQDPRIVAHAQHAQSRLHRRWTRMQARGKNSNKTAVAVARELAGFVWSIASNEPCRR